MGAAKEPQKIPSSISVRTLLEENDNRICLCETHDRNSTEVIRDSVGNQGQTFDGIWYSGLCQTTHLGIPDTEIISPLQRASLLALHGDLKRTTTNRPLCAAFDADSGGDVAEIPALVAVLALVGVGMIIIEDKAISAPGGKVNSLEATSALQGQADPHEFAEVVKAFKASAENVDKEMMITARIETFTTRIVKSDPEEEKASAEAALREALRRAQIYREADVDAIMIHSKSKSPDEVLEFLREYRAMDSKTPLVVVPTTYSKTTKQTLYDAGANVIIYANHLMRAKISAVSAISEKVLAQAPDLFNDDAELSACIEARNYGCLLRMLKERSYWGEESREARIYRVMAEKYAADNIQVTVKDLLDGDLAGCEADKRIIPVKDLLKINSQQVVPVEELVG